MLLQNSPFFKNGNVGNLLALVKYDEGLKSELCKHGERVGKLENCLKTLNCWKTDIELYMSELQDSLEPDLVNDLDCLSTKEEITKLIEGRGHSAASTLLCSIAQGHWMDVMQDVVGVVALLGTVGSIKLSRILAEHLGEDQMVAVVCKSYEVARALEQYDHNGEIDSRLGLHAEAIALSKSISGRFLVVCLEDIRPYLGGVEVNDPQRKLILPAPRLLSGNYPPGFIGYAVNLVNLEHPHIDYRTESGHGLRETLFYRLFSKVQVYETREEMENARNCITHGAVSLDGGILRKNGIMSLGFRNPEIYFPVQITNVSPERKKIMEQIKEKQLELRTTLQGINVASEKLDRARHKFNRKQKQFQKYLDNIDDAINDTVTPSTTPSQCTQRLGTPSKVII
ncbi:hypothetical protein E1A91_D11G015400v1 [Gossypium mustelinum]|nr:hypothetical protein E1A91_D11G015400v1 [Gossypium mustelinum]